MAKGNSSAHSMLRRPLKSNKVTAAALTLPMLITPIATQKHRPKLLTT